MVTRFIGKEPLFRGKTLYELCCNLRNCGEGRVFYRHVHADFPETTFVRLTKVQPDMSDMTRQGGTAWGERVYRGRELGVCRIDSGYKADWIMVPKEQEAEFCKITAVLPKKPKPPTFFDCPPVLQLLMTNELEKLGKVKKSEQFQLELDSRWHKQYKD